jgi:hypothetical protein
MTNFLLIILILVNGLTAGLLYYCLALPMLESRELKKIEEMKKEWELEKNKS